MLVDAVGEAFNYPPNIAQSIVNNYSDEEIRNWGHDTSTISGGNIGGSFTKMEPKTIALLILGAAILYRMWG